MLSRLANIAEQRCLCKFCHSLYNTKWVSSQELALSSTFDFQDMFLCNNEPNSGPHAFYKSREK